MVDLALIKNQLSMCVSICLFCLIWMDVDFLTLTGSGTAKRRLYIVVKGFSTKQTLKAE